jgi:hypothetical protein
MFKLFLNERAKLTKEVITFESNEKLIKFLLEETIPLSHIERISEIKSREI